MSNLEFLSDHGSCECLDSETCPKHVENCKCPRGFVRECEDSSSSSSSKGQSSSKAGAGECEQWYCACKDQMRPTCSRCVLNGQFVTPSDPCTSPSICVRRQCLYPFLSQFDTDTPVSGTPTLNHAEFLSWINTTLTNFMPRTQQRYYASALEWHRDIFQETRAGQLAFFFDDNLYYDRKMAWSLFCHADEDSNGLLSAGELMKNIFGDTDGDGLVSLLELGRQYRQLWSMKFKNSTDDSITQIAGYVPSDTCPNDIECSVFSGGEDECDGGQPAGLPLQLSNHQNFFPDPQQLLLPSALFLSAINMTTYGTVSYQSAQALFSIDAVTWM